MDYLAIYTANLVQRGCGKAQLEQLFLPIFFFGQLSPQQKELISTYMTYVCQNII